VSDAIEQFDREGFVLLEGGISEDLLGRLREGLDPILDGQASGQARLQTILQPEHYHPSFVEFLNIAALNQLIQELLDVPTPSFSGMACLTGRSSHSICRWHRDFPDSEPDVAKAFESFPRHFVQLNCAVYDDPSLWIIPGTHDRLSNEEELAWANRFGTLDFVDQVERLLAVDDHPLSGMPGAIHAKLKAGDCLVYNPLIWHAAEYRPEWRRATLHLGYRTPGVVDALAICRWGLNQNPWLLEPDYLGKLGPYFGPALGQMQNAIRKYHPDLQASSQSDT
jgi:hypothetical protein